LGSNPILTPTRIKILSGLAVKGPMSIHQLSHSIGFYLSATQYHVYRLHEKQLIKFESRPAVD
jgi:predicted transcriptional regulator